MYTKRYLNLLNRPTVDHQTRIDFLSEYDPKFRPMADELWETKYIAPDRRQEIYDTIDAEFERLLELA